MSLAFYFAFYSNGLKQREEDAILAERPDGEEYRIKDDKAVLDFFWERRNASPESLLLDGMGREDFWGRDLKEIPGLYPLTLENLRRIRRDGAGAAFALAAGDEA